VEQSVTIQGASNLNESDVETMLEEAEKYAAADKKKRENIDLRNQAETLCFEAEKELSLLKDSISDTKQQNITNLIQEIRQHIQDNNLDSLQSSVENLKTAMKDMVAAKVDTDSDVDSMANLNDL